jgi:hypothetical protein
MLRYCTRCGLSIGEKLHSSAHVGAAHASPAEVGAAEAGTAQVSAAPSVPRYVTTTAPDIMAPSSAAPDSTAPDIAAPDISAPDPTTPDPTTPDVIIIKPDSIAPEPTPDTPLDSTARVITTPDTTAPDPTTAAAVLDLTGLDGMDDVAPDGALPSGAGWLPGFAEVNDVPHEDPGPTDFHPPMAGRSGAGRRSRVVISAAAGVLVLGGAAWLASNNHPIAGARQTGAAAPPSRARSAQPSGQHTASPPARSQRPSPTASASAASSPTARYGVVAIAPALARRSEAAQIAALLDSYFAAVNHRDYQQYSSLFERRHRLTARQFARGYRSTHDSGAALVDLANKNRGVAATVTFQSHQEPAASPDHARCNNWRITLYLRRIGAVYLIAPPPHGYQAVYRACG